MMRIAGLMIAAGVVASAAGCGASSRTMARFDRYGDVDKQAVATPRVAAVAEVKVYYGMAPEGFSLRDNELKAEAGYDHQILGPVVVYWNEHGPTCNEEPELTKRDVIAQLRTTAYQQGGNAVIYALSEIPDDPDKDLCWEVEGSKWPLGRGWVVVAGARTPAPATPAGAPPATP
jgi:hypothetical protein